MNVDDSDDESSDSDYRSDDEKCSEDQQEKIVEKKIVQISTKRKREILSEWEEMKSQYESDTKQKMQKAIIPRPFDLKLCNPNKATPKKQKLQQMLKSILSGRSSTEKRMSSSEALIENNSNAIAKDSIVHAVENLNRKIKVREKVKFAGQEI